MMSRLNNSSNEINQLREFLFKKTIKNLLFF